MTGGAFGDCPAPAVPAWNDASVSNEPKFLNEGEHVVIATRTHWKALIRPVVVLLLTTFVAVYLGTLVNGQVSSDGAQQTLGVVVGVVAAVLIVWWVIRPFIAWYTTTYTFTNRRFIQRSGFVAKEGRTIPLNRISGVDFEMSVTDRIFGCGTLVVSDASEQGRVPLNDVPHVEEVQMKVAEELHRLTSGGGSHHDDGT